MSLSPYFFIHLAIFSKLFCASLSSLYQDHASLYVARLFPLSLCLATSKRNSWLQPYSQLEETLPCYKAFMQIVAQLGNVYQIDSVFLCCGDIVSEILF